MHPDLTPKPQRRVIEAAPRGAGRHAARRLAAALPAMLLAVCLPATSRAIGPAPPAAGAPVLTGAHPYVGRVQTENMRAGNNHWCTGSEIRQGTVLTAAHCIDDDGPFIRYQPVGGTQGFALGMQEPRYSPVGLSNHDVGLLLLLNGPLRPVNGFFPVLANPTNSNERR